MRAILTFGASLLPFLSATSALHPPGGQTGTTIEVLATGKHEDWPPDFWVSRKGLTIEALEKSGQLKITIAKDAQPGPVLVRLLGQKGISIAHTFVISQQEETLESEPNNHLAEAQKIEKIPALINGRLQKKGDTDFFQFHLKKGETLSAKLDGYSLYSPIDAFLHILDYRGYELAIASDTHNLDPHLVYTARQNGMHTLQVLAVTSKASTSIQYAGDENSVYRLKLSLGKPSSRPPSAEHTELSATK
ncbi:MAG: PPC domain-containing protein, partial [Opitutae bacterium]